MLRVRSAGFSEALRGLGPFWIASAFLLAAAVASIGLRLHSINPFMPKGPQGCPMSLAGVERYGDGVVSSDSG